MMNASDKNKLIKLLENRFNKNKTRHQDISWELVLDKLMASPDKLNSLWLMEETGGEPDVIRISKDKNQLVFIDCSAESPSGRRSLCYDQEALNARKENKPKSSAVQMANEMGVKIINEEQYRFLQTLDKFDLKTSSWIKTPEEIRNLDGALFCDRRYNTVFMYHNGASSYYAARGFRAYLEI